MEKDRRPDWQYHNLLEEILETGREVLPIHGERSKMLLGRMLRYRMEDGFPLMTERDLSGRFFQSALAEHVAFLHGARTHEELTKFGCSWWKRWVTAAKCSMFDLPPGDLGPGSYGAAWRSFPTAKGVPFDQLAHLMRQMQDRPNLRTHILSPWIPPYTLQHSGYVRKVVVAPCHGLLHILLYPETKEMDVHHFQRSADVPVGLVFNIVQYAAFGMMVSQVLGYSFKELVYTISDAHIYESQYDSVLELLRREPFPFPKVVLDPAVSDLLDFRPEHFRLENYTAHRAMTIPTPT
jgi:thymidylate synthase